MDTLLGYMPELVGAAGALWAGRERWRRSRAEAARLAAEAAQAALAVRLGRVSDIAQRFADALARRDYAELDRIEAERKARGL